MTSAHVYVLHLAFADFLFLLNLPIVIYQKSHQMMHLWNFGKVLCYLHRSGTKSYLILLLYHIMPMSVLLKYKSLRKNMIQEN